MIEKEPGTAGPRPPRPRPAGGGAGLTGAGGGGPYSAVISRIRLVLLSSVKVLAPTGVATVCSTAKLVGLFSLMTVRVPSPCELKASIVLGLKVAPSTPVPIGSVARIFPVSAFRITMLAGLRHAAKRMW